MRRPELSVLKGKYRGVQSPYSGGDGVGFELNTILSKRDSVDLLELIQKSTFCTNQNDFKGLFSDFRSIFPFDFALSGFAGMGANNKIESYNLINVNYPGEWLHLYDQRKYHLIDPIVMENFTRFRPQYWADTYKRNLPPRDFAARAQDFGLSKGYTYGLRNFKGNEGSLFSLSGGSIEHNARSQTVLEHVVPHFHYALSRVLNGDDKKKKSAGIKISSREKEVLKWLKEGKSTWDVSVLLGISERTVKFHVNKVMQTLDAVNRTQAVAIALQRGLIDLE